jgi:hypothetical protein
MEIYKVDSKWSLCLNSLFHRKKSKVAHILLWAIWADTVNSKNRVNRWVNTAKNNIDTFVINNPWISWCQIFDLDNHRKLIQNVEDTIFRTLRYEHICFWTDSLGFQLNIWNFNESNYSNISVVATNPVYISELFIKNLFTCNSFQIHDFFYKWFHKYFTSNWIKYKDWTLEELKTILIPIEEWISVFWINELNKVILINNNSDLLYLNSEIKNLTANNITQYTLTSDIIWWKNHHLKWCYEEVSAITNQLISEVNSW